MLIDHGIRVEHLRRSCVESVRQTQIHWMKRLLISVVGRKVYGPRTLAHLSEQDQNNERYLLEGDPSNMKAKSLYWSYMKIEEPRDISR